MGGITQFQKMNLKVAIFSFSLSYLAYLYSKSQKKTDEKKNNDTFVFPLLKYMQDPVEKSQESKELK